MIGALTSWRMSTRQIRMHEIGHSLGLDEQYKSGLEGNASRRYSSAIAGKGVMNKSKSISCDDADGIVNLIDIALGNARGGDKGWKSLCPKSPEYYVRGQSAMRGPYTITTEDGFRWKFEVYDKGKQVHSEEIVLEQMPGYSLFTPVPETVLQRDALGRPVLGQGPQGEQIYHSYFYDQQMKLVFRDGKAIRGETFTVSWVNNNKKTRKLGVYMRKDNRVSLIGLILPSNGNSKAFYAERYSSGATHLEITIRFNKRHQLISGDRFGNPPPSSKSLLMGKEDAARLKALLPLEIKRQAARQEWDQITGLLMKWYLEEVKK